MTACHFCFTPAQSIQEVDLTGSNLVDSNFFDGSKLPSGVHGKGCCIDFNSPGGKCTPAEIDQATRKYAAGSPPVADFVVFAVVDERALAFELSVKGWVVWNGFSITSQAP